MATRKKAAPADDFDLFGSAPTPSRRKRTAAPATPMAGGPSGPAMSGGPSGPAMAGGPAPKRRRRALDSDTLNQLYG